MKGSSTNIKAPKGSLLTISKTKMKTKSGQTWKEATEVLATRAPTPLRLQNSRPCSPGTQKGTNVFVASLFLSFSPPPDFFSFLLCYYSSTAFCCMLSKADRRGLTSETWRRLRCRHHLCSNPPVSVTLHSAPRLKPRSTLITFTLEKLPSISSQVLYTPRRPLAD